MTIGPSNRERIATWEVTVSDLEFAAHFLRPVQEAVEAHWCPVSLLSKDASAVDVELKGHQISTQTSKPGRIA